MSEMKTEDPPELVREGETRCLFKKEFLRANDACIQCFWQDPNDQHFWCMCV